MATPPVVRKAGRLLALVLDCTVALIGITLLSGGYAPALVLLGALAAVAVIHWVLMPGKPARRRAARRAPKRRPASRTAASRARARRDVNDMVKAASKIRKGAR